VHYADFMAFLPLKNLGKQKENFMAATTVPAPVRTSTTPPVPTAISQWAARMEFTDLSPEAIYQAKRFLLDSVGCALAAISSTM